MLESKINYELGSFGLQEAKKFSLHLQVEVNSSWNSSVSKKYISLPKSGDYSAYIKLLSLLVVIYKDSNLQTLEIRQKVNFTPTFEK